MGNKLRSRQSIIDARRREIVKKPAIRTSTRIVHRNVLLPKTLCIDPARIKFKILFIYKDYHDRRRLYGEMLQIFGHTVIFHRIVDKNKAAQISALDIKLANPNLVWLSQPSFLANHVLSKQAVDYIKNRKIPVACYGTFGTSVPYTDWLEAWRTIDYLFVHSIKLNDYLHDCGIDSEYLPIGFYPNQYYREACAKSIPITFMGSCQTYNDICDKRCEYIMALKEMGIVVYGKSFRQKLNDITVIPYKSHAEQRRIYGLSSINLDLPFINSPIAFYDNMVHIKNRFFEVPAIDNFLVTVRDKKFLAIFDEDEVGYYDDNVESLKETVSRYLKNQNEAREMARRAYVKVYSKHTFAHRFQTMLKFIYDRTGATK